MRPSLTYPEGSREWGLLKMHLTGHLMPPHPDEHLDMRDLGVPLDELESMCQDLAVDPDVKSLDLSGNMLGVAHRSEGEQGQGQDPGPFAPPPRPSDGHPYPVLPGVESLAKAFLANPDALTQVDVSRNSLGDFGQANLLHLLRSLRGKQHLAILDVGANGILGPDGMRYPSLRYLCHDLVPSLPHLIHLSLAYSELHCEAAKLLAHALQRENAPNLLALDVGCNRLTEDPRGEHDLSGLAAMAQALRGNTSLTALNLRDNRIGNHECRELLCACGAMPCLVSLDLSENCLTSTGAAAVQEHLWADEHLLHLNLNGNPLDEGKKSSGKSSGGKSHGGGGLPGIAEMVAQNHTLTALEVAGTGLANCHYKCFDKALRENTSLVRLELFANADDGGESEDDEEEEEGFSAFGGASVGGSVSVSSSRNMRKLTEHCSANSELRRINASPLDYDYGAQTKNLRRLILMKVHTLRLKVLCKLLDNATFTTGADQAGGGQMLRKLLELVPPDRKQILESAQKHKHRHHRHHSSSLGLNGLGAEETVPASGPGGVGDDDDDDDEGGSGGARYVGGEGGKGDAAGALFLKAEVGLPSGNPKHAPMFPSIK